MSVMSRASDSGDTAARAAVKTVGEMRVWRGVALGLNRGSLNW